jgi:hypothetical protein
MGQFAQRGNGMFRSWRRALRAAAVVLTLAAVAQEVRRPRHNREWHGRVLGFVPYDFRLPTLDRIRESLWNQDERRIFTPRVFGVGWTLNLFWLVTQIRRRTRERVQNAA